jgi:hypothetical protein
MVRTPVRVNVLEKKILMIVDNAEEAVYSKIE